MLRSSILRKVKKIKKNQRYATQQHFSFRFPYYHNNNKENKI